MGPTDELPAVVLLVLDIHDENNARLVQGGVAVIFSTHTTGSRKVRSRSFGHRIKVIIVLTSLCIVVFLLQWAAPAGAAATLDGDSLMDTKSKGLVGIQK